MGQTKGEKDTDVKKSSVGGELTVEDLKRNLSVALEDNKKLLQDNKKLYEALQNQNEERWLRRLDYLLAVCNTKCFDDSEFQRKCAEEIEKLLTLKSEPA